MAITDVYDFYKKMEDEKIILSFKGEFTAELLTSILHILESKMNALQITTQKKKRVFNVLVECFQNLYHHIEMQDSNASEVQMQKSALIIVKHVADKFVVRTGNYIHHDGIVELKRKLAMVNALGSDELRNMYRTKLSNDQRSEKGTAGLGLIDIARKSKGKLEYEFLEIDANSSFFCLNVVIE
ncbi:MAG: SiaB family protein kinase [Crocinitomicaceae bacterium]|nr:SiaB family protein kinase [Crocinitomicaceae bacterium]